MDVKCGLHSFEESLEIIEANLDICRKARQTLQKTIAGPTSGIGMTQKESTTNKIKGATSLIIVAKEKWTKDKNKEQGEIRENDDIPQTLSLIHI